MVQDKQDCSRDAEVAENGQDDHVDVLQCH